MTEASIKARLLPFIMENAQSKGITQVGDDDSLTETGIVDSLGIFRLVSFLEETFGIRVGDEEITNQNFESIRTIESFINGKLAAKGEKAASR
jgi:acyl carrier protein